MAGLVLLAAGAGAYALLTYRSVRLGPRDRAVLTTLRIATLALLAVCLLRPMLILKVAVPQQNFVGVLLDDSRSMQVSDLEGHPRGNYVTENFGAATSPLLAKLGEMITSKSFVIS